MNQKTCRAEDFPRAGNVYDLDSVVEKHSDFRRAAFAICRNQSHSALRTVAGLIEGELVAGQAARRTDVDLPCAALNRNRPERGRTSLQHWQATRSEHHTGPAFHETSPRQPAFRDRKSTRLNSSHLGISYAV